MGDTEKTSIRSNILHVLLQAPAPVSTPLGVAVAAIANWDFPETWPEVIPAMLQTVGATGTDAEVS